MHPTVGVKRVLPVSTDSFRFDAEHVNIGMILVAHLSPIYGIDLWAPPRPNINEKPSKTLLPLSFRGTWPRIRSTRSMVSGLSHQTSNKNSLPSQLHLGFTSPHFPSHHSSTHHVRISDTFESMCKPSVGLRMGSSAVYTRGSVLDSLYFIQGAR